MYILEIVLICILSYLIGNFSAVYLLKNIVKTIRNNKKVTTTSESIYLNINRFLGLCCLIFDFLKIYLFILYIQDQFFININHTKLLFLYGFCMILGHCFPLLNKFKGGRGIIVYIALLCIFINPLYLFFVVIGATILVLMFKQIRFAQYIVVITPTIISYFISNDLEFRLVFSSMILMAIINFLVSKRIGEI
jgi:glycerol-3-phosphate acyltransferase PlsY